jgi:hypothetical protein
VGGGKSMRECGRTNLFYLWAEGYIFLENTEEKYPPVYPLKILKYRNKIVKIQK